MGQTKDTEEIIVQFKNFINSHPKLLVHVRKNGLSWQYYFEQWLALGEDHSYWDKYRSSRRRNDGKSLDQNFQLIEAFIKNLDIKKLQKQLKELNGIISTVDGLLQNYLKNKEIKPSSIDLFTKYKD